MPSSPTSPAAPPPLRLHSAALSDVGRRRTNNEDSFVADPALGLYAVADGMGGHAAGEVASQMAIAAIQRAVPRAPDAAFLAEPSVENRRVLLDWLSQIVTAIGTAIHARARDEPQLAGMGCTLDVALVRGRGLCLAHVGDSRAYGARAVSARPTAS